MAGVPKNALSYNILVRACDVDVVGSAAAQAALLAGFLADDSVTATMPAASDSDGSAATAVTGPGGLEAVSEAPAAAATVVPDFVAPPFPWTQALHAAAHDPVRPPQAAEAHDAPCRDAPESGAGEQAAAARSSAADSAGKQAVVARSGAADSGAGEQAAATRGGAADSGAGEQTAATRSSAADSGAGKQAGERLTDADSAALWNGISVIAHEKGFQRRPKNKYGSWLLSC